MPRCNLVRSALSVTALITLAAWAGCGSGGRETVEVKGAVTLDGQPVAEAAVMFSGPEGGSPTTAKSDASGNFTVRAVPGLNNVAVSKTETSGGAPAQDDGTMPADGGSVQVKALVPAKYSDFRNSGLTVDVASGMAPVRLELTSK